MKLLDPFRRAGTFIRSVVEDARAWRRRERRVAPRGARGRVFEKKAAPSGLPGGPAAAPAGAPRKARVVKSITLRPSRVYRAATGTWEEIQPPGAHAQDQPKET